MFYNVNQENVILLLLYTNIFSPLIPQLYFIAHQIYSILQLYIPYIRYKYIFCMHALGYSHATPRKNTNIRSSETFIEKFINIYEKQKNIQLRIIL